MVGFGQTQEHANKQEAVIAEIPFDAIRSKPDGYRFSGWFIINAVYWQIVIDDYAIGLFSL